MKRRRFIQAIAAAPAAPAVFAQQPSQPPPAQPGRAGRARGPQDIPNLELTAPDTVAAPAPRFFNPRQYAALRKLSDLFAPPLKGNPGALECEAPEFLDFLIGVSPAGRQQLYRNGLDALNAQAQKHFGKAFADVDASQAHAILQPLLVAVAWVQDPPQDPVKNFIFAARQDITTATRNSRQWAEAGAASGRRGNGGFGGGLYWNPIDPVYRG